MTANGAKLAEPGSTFPRLTFRLRGRYLAERTAALGARAPTRWFSPRRLAQMDVRRGSGAVICCSDQPDVSFDRLDHFIHLSVPYLFGHAKSEAFDRMERNMRR